MTLPNQRQLQAQKRRTQLIKTALRLFADRGMENTPIKDIAAEAGVAQGLIYHYFRSKDDLFEAIVSQYTSVPEVTAFFSGTDGRPAREVLTEAGNMLLRLLGSQSDLQSLARILLRESLIRPETQPATRLLQAAGMDSLAGYLNTRIAAGELRPHNPEVTARMLIGSVGMLALSTAPAESLLPEVIDALLQGTALRQP